MIVGSTTPRRRSDRPGLVLFLNAGDPPLGVIEDVMMMLDDERVDGLELAVPFPDSVTDGATIRESSLRALGRGVGYDETLALIAATAPHLEHLQLVAMVDWRHTIVPRSFETVVDDLADAGADALLAHAFPPRLKTQLYDAARARLPLVTTCYPSSGTEVVTDAVANAGAYLYLASSRARTGTSAASIPDLTSAIEWIRRIDQDVTVAVGFGVATADDVTRVHRQGADRAIVGSAFVDQVARGGPDNRLVERLRAFVRSLRAPVPPAG